MAESDSAQLIKRVGRPDPDGIAPTGRWQQDRVVLDGKDAFEARINDFFDSINLKFVDAAEGLWKGRSGNEYLQDSEALRVLQAIRDNGLNLKKINTQDLLLLSTKIQELKSINDSVRFAVRDTFQDSIIYRNLRQLLSMPEVAEADRKIIRGKLVELLNRPTQDIDITLRDKSLEDPSLVIDQMFKSTCEEAAAEFIELSSKLKSGGKAQQFIDTRLKDLEFTERNFGDARADIEGTFMGAETTLDLVKTTKSQKDFIMPEFSSQPKETPVMVKTTGEFADKLKQANVSDKQMTALKRS
jgi:hypothetical protein